MDTPYKGTTAQWEHDYLQQLWWVERDDRRMKNEDDRKGSTLEHLNNEHMSRHTMYEMGW